MHNFTIRVPKPLEESSTGRALIELTRRSLLTRLCTQTQVAWLCKIQSFLGKKAQ